MWWPTPAWLDKCLGLVIWHMIKMIKLALLLTVEYLPYISHRLSEELDETQEAMVWCKTSTPCWRILYSLSEPMIFWSSVNSPSTCLGTTMQSRGGGCEGRDHTGFGLLFLAQQTIGTVGTSTTYLSLLTVASYHESALRTKGMGSTWSLAMQVALLLNRQWALLLCIEEPGCYDPPSQSVWTF